MYCIHHRGQQLFYSGPVWDNGPGGSGMRQREFTAQKVMLFSTKEAAEAALIEIQAEPFYTMLCADITYKPQTIEAFKAGLCVRSMVFVG